MKYLLLKTLSIFFQRNLNIIIILVMYCLILSQSCLILSIIIILVMYCLIVSQLLHKIILVGLYIAVLLMASALPFVYSHVFAFNVIS